MKKKLQFIIDVEVDVNAKIPLQVEKKKKPELVPYLKKKRDQEQKLMNVLLEHENLLWNYVVEKAFFHLEDITSESKAEELEDASEECIEECIELMESVEDATYFQDCLENKTLKNHTSVLFDQFKPSIEKIQIKDLSA